MGQPSFISSSYTFGAPQHRALVSAMSCFFSSELPPAKRGTVMRRISEISFECLLHVKYKKKKRQNDVSSPNLKAAFPSVAFSVQQTLLIALLLPSYYLYYCKSKVGNSCVCACVCVCVCVYLFRVLVGSVDLMNEVWS